LNVNYSEMNLTQLKAAAKDKGLKGYSTMKKAELVSALNTLVASKPSFIDMIKARMAESREARSNAGRKAGSEATVTEKMTVARKNDVYRAQRGGKLTARQLRRLRKTFRRAAA
jgi:hypothetical protein